MDRDTLWEVARKTVTSTKPPHNLKLDSVDKQDYIDRMTDALLANLQPLIGQIEQAAVDLHEQRKQRGFNTD